MLHEAPVEIEHSCKDEGIKLSEAPVIVAPTPLSTKNPTPASTKIPEGPRILTQNLSDMAKDFLKQFEEAIEQGDG